MSVNFVVKFDFPNFFNLKKFHNKTGTSCCNHNVVIPTGEINNAVIFFHNGAKEIHSAVIATIFMKFALPVLLRGGGRRGEGLLRRRHRVREGHLRVRPVEFDFERKK